MKISPHQPLAHQSLLDLTWRPFSLSVLLCALLGSALIGCDEEEEGLGGARFQKVTIDNQAYGPAFGAVGDIDGDGRPDIVTAHFGPLDEIRSSFTLPGGEISVYYQGDNVRSWRREVVLPRSAGVYLPQEPHLEDIDGDGDLDIAIGTGFLICSILPTINNCGGLMWFEQSESGWVQHTILEPDQRLFYHTAVFTDLDGDGLKDMITVAEDRRIKNGFVAEEAEVQWFRGDATSPTLFESRARVIGPGLGSLPSLVDMDGDGDMDIVSAEYFAGLGASFAWYEQLMAPTAAGTGVWARHVMDDQSGPAIQGSFIDDLYGDGRRIFVGSNHTNTLRYDDDPKSAIFVFEPPTDPRQPWSRRQISAEMVSGSEEAGQAAPGIFGWGDADGDGDIDLLVSGDADPRIFLLEQKAPGEFTTLLFDEEISQAGGIKIVDFDGDGVSEILVSDFESNHIYLYLRSEDGAHPLATIGRAEATTPPPEKTPAPLKLTVRYEGAETAPLRARLYAGKVASGEALQSFDEPAPTFPLSIDFGTRPIQDYSLSLYLDLPPENLLQPGPEDIQELVQLRLPAVAQASVTIGAEEEPTGAPAPVTVRAVYPAGGSGNLIVGFYRSLPPAGPPENPQTVLIDGFPADVSYPQLPGGRFYAFGFLDLPPENAFQPGPEDPIGESEAFVVDGEPVVIELPLALP